MNTQQIEEALKAIEDAKIRGGEILKKIVERERTIDVSTEFIAMANSWEGGLGDRNWAYNGFDYEDITGIDVDSYGIEQDHCERRIHFSFVAERNCRGSYTDSHSLYCPEWLFDDPTNENIVRYVDEYCRKIEAKLVEKRRKEAEKAESIRIAKEERDRSEFKRLSRLYGENNAEE